MDPKTQALTIFKLCQEAGIRTYENCMKDKYELFPNAFPGQHQFYCVNQKRMKETFCLHEEKEKSGITSSGLRQQSESPQ